MWDLNPRAFLHYELDQELLLVWNLRIPKPQRSPVTTWVILHLRSSGIEPEFTVWKTAILPLNYERIGAHSLLRIFTRCENVLNYERTRNFFIKEEKFQTQELELLD